MNNIFKITKRKLQTNCNKRRFIKVVKEKQMLNNPGFFPAITH